MAKPFYAQFIHLPLRPTFRVNPRNPWQHLLQLLFDEYANTHTTRTAEKSTVISIIRPIRVKNHKVLKRSQCHNQISELE